MKRTFVNISSGAIGYILMMLLNLFFTPLIVKNLDSESYGLQSLVNVIIGFLMVADMGLDIPVTKAVADFNAQNNSKKLNEILNTTLFIYLIIGFFGLLVLCIISPILADDVFKISASYKERAVNVFYLAGIGFVGGLFSMWGKAIFNGLLRYDISNAINSVSSLLSLSLGTLLVVKGYGVETYVFIRVAFIFLSGFAYLLVSKALLNGFKISFHLNKEVWLGLKSQIGYGFLLRISGIVTSRLDQILIGVWISVAAVGYYSIPLLMITSLGGLLNSMIHYLFPKMSGLNATGKEQELKKLFLNSSRYLAMLTFAIFMPFLVFGNKLLPLWVGKDIAGHSGTVLVLLLVATMISTIFGSLVNLYLSAVGRLSLITRYILIRSTCLGVLMFILIKPYGLNGVGISMISVAILDGFFYFYVTSKLIRVNTSALFFKLYPKLILCFALSGLMVNYLYLAKIRNLLTLAFGVILYVALVIILAFLFKLFNREEKKTFSELKTRILGNKI